MCAEFGKFHLQDVLSDHCGMEVMEPRKGVKGLAFELGVEHCANNVFIDFFGRGVVGIVFDVLEAFEYEVSLQVLV
jgi:hypothetical protein